MEDLLSFIQAVYKEKLTACVSFNTEEQILKLHTVL